MSADLTVSTAARGAAWRTVRAGSFRTRYFEAGDPRSETVVLLHDGGHGSDARLCWGAVADMLAADYHVIAPDLLGWGGTDKAVVLGTDPYGFRIDHLAELLRVLDIRTPAHFVGASFGGSIVLRAAAEGRAPWPMWTATSVAGTGGPWKTARFAELARYEATPQDARRVALLAVEPFPGLDEHVRLRYENSRAPGHWEAMQAGGLLSPFAPHTPSSTYPASLSQATMPILLIECRRDVVIEPGWSQHVADAAGGGAKRLLLDTAHQPSVDHPACVAEHLRAFFARHPAPPKES